MGEKGGCCFCKGKKIMRKSPEIGEPLIEYYCPECSNPDETKYPKVTCPVCNGTGNIRKLTSIYNQGSITYTNNRRNKVCYMCNGKGEINIISLGDKKPSFNPIKRILKRKEEIPQEISEKDKLEKRKMKALKTYKKYKNQKERDKKYGYRLPLKYKLFDITKKLIKGLVLLGIILLVFTQLPTIANLIEHSNQINGAINSIQNININTNTNTAALETNAGIRVLNYTLRGHNGHIQFIVYGGLNNWLVRQPRAISYDSYSSPPTDKDFVMKALGYKSQNEALNKLVYNIQNIAPDRNNQARIAISLVQHIPYDYTALKLSNFTERYPYQVIYDNKGVCEGKSELLAYLLKKLGFGVALFNFKEENHMAVGIKCAPEYAYRDTGYCFVESTEPTIITDSWGTYAGGIKLYSMPEVIEISNGYTFNASMEYHDALLFKQLENKELNSGQYYEWENLVRKYGIEINENNSTNNNIQRGYNEIYNGRGILEDHTFDYIPITLRISTIHLSINASKPVSAYVLNGSKSKIINGFEHGVIPPDSVIQGCKSNNFKKQVDLTCDLYDEYTSLGVLIYNEGIGNNTIKIDIIGKKVR